MVLTKSIKFVLVPFDDDKPENDAKESLKAKKVKTKSEPMEIGKEWQIPVWSKR